MKELSYKILLIEDDPAVQDFLEICFSGELSIAGSLEEAREKLKKSKPDLVILDRMLPDGDGVWLCEDIRRDPKLHPLPVLILTCKAAPGDKVLGFKAGADDYLTKPFEMDELKARVNALFRRTEKLRRGRHMQKILWKY